MSEYKNEYTFWQLIEEYVIDIPIIQRDYAQGREFEKVEEIRNGFLDDIYDTIINDRHLDLDFVYGSLKENKTFIPLDGQQRLTTLFLLHWYLAIKEKHIDTVRENLKKFTYETRTSSREFCNALVNDDIAFKNADFSTLEKISDNIKDAHWFFMSWKKDPTIKSMLVMLDAIHKKFKNSSNLFEKLLNDKDMPISFQFIKLDNFGLEDSLYIKMNARGKALTPFENFKAKFQQLLQKREDDRKFEQGFTEEFTNKMDGEWTDLFWNYRDKGSNVFDNEMMNFIRAITINNYALRTNSKELEEGMNYLIDNKSHVSFMKYMEFGCFDENTIQEIVIALDNLKNGNSEIKVYLPDKIVLDEKALFEKIIRNSTENKLTYTERVLFFAITQYFVTNNSNIDSAEFSEWIRVVRNLSVNTIDNSVGEFAKSIQSIKELIVHSRDILNFLVDTNNSISRFLGDQVEEERIKAVLILKEDRWKQAIVKAENHGYFKGQIGFILKFSGILSAYKMDNKMDWSVQINDEYYNKFIEYFNKASAIFNDKGLSIDSDLWSRALLCKGDYLLRSSRNLSFLIDSHRDISWKRLLRDNNEKRDYVKELLDDIDIKNIYKCLENIINKSTVSDWRRYFIKIPSVIQGCGAGRYIRKESDNDILLLNSSTTSGYNNEYYTYALYFKLKSMPNVKPEYYPDRGAENWKYVYFEDNDVQIYYSKVGDAWCYEVYEGKIPVELNTQEEVIDFLKKQKYIA